MMMSGHPFQAEYSLICGDENLPRYGSLLILSRHERLSVNGVGMLFLASHGSKFHIWRSSGQNILCEGYSRNGCFEECLLWKRAKELHRHCLPPGFTPKV